MEKNNRIVCGVGKGVQIREENGLVSELVRENMRVRP